MSKEGSQGDNTPPSSKWGKVKPKTTPATSPENRGDDTPAILVGTPLAARKGLIKPIAVHSGGGDWSDIVKKLPISPKKPEDEVQEAATSPNSASPQEVDAKKVSPTRPFSERRLQYLISPKNHNSREYGKDWAKTLDNLSTSPQKMGDGVQEEGAPTSSVSPTSIDERVGLPTRSFSDAKFRRNTHPNGRGTNSTSESNIWTK